MSRRTAGLSQLGPSASAMRHKQPGHRIGRTAKRYAQATKRGQLKAHLFGKNCGSKRPITLATINLPPDNG